MSAAPHLKIYTSDGLYIAACKYAEDAAALVALNGDGSTIRDGHRTADIVWKEGSEKQPAAESYDFVCSIVTRRVNARVVKQLAPFIGALS